MRAKLAFAVVVASVSALFLFPGASTAKAAPAPVDLTNQFTCSVDCTVELVGFSGAGGQTSAVLAVTNDVTGQSRRVSVPVTRAER